MRHVGGQVVSEPTFNTDDPSLNPAEVFTVKFCEKGEKDARNGRIKKTKRSWGWSSEKIIL